MPDLPIPNFGYGTAAPTDTSIYAVAGSIVFNSAPSSGQPLGWVCTVAGRPGTWIPMVNATGGVATYTAAPTTITAGTALAILTGNTAATITMPKGNSYGAGFRLSAIVTNNVATTFAAASGDGIVGTAAVTAANAPVTFQYDGGTNWYRV